MSLRHAAVVAGLALGLMSGTAHASMITYDVSGLFADAKILSGSFSVDNSKASFNQYSNVNIQVTGFSEFNIAVSVSFGSPDTGFGLFGLAFNNSSQQSLELVFNANHNDFDLISIPSENLITLADNQPLSTSVESVPLLSGTISPAVSTVPVPASAPLFGAALLALGVVGYDAKRKKAPATA